PPKEWSHPKSSPNFGWIPDRCKGFRPGVAVVEGASIRFAAGRPPAVRDEDPGEGLLLVQAPGDDDDHDRVGRLGGPRDAALGAGADEEPDRAAPRCAGPGHGGGADELDDRLEPGILEARERDDDERDRGAEDQPRQATDPGEAHRLAAQAPDAAAVEPARRLGRDDDLDEVAGHAGPDQRGHGLVDGLGRVEERRDRVALDRGGAARAHGRTPEVSGPADAPGPSGAPAPSTAARTSGDSAARASSSAVHGCCLDAVASRSRATRSGSTGGASFSCHWRTYVATAAISASESAAPHPGITPS